MVNNVAAVPEGTVDNSADEEPGTPLPAEGVIGPDSGLTRDARGVYTNIEWGSEVWLEPKRNCKVSRQKFDFWPAIGFEPIADGKTYTTIVYFHPNGVNHHFETGSDIYNNVALPAHEAGYHFISVEFRHPVADEYLADYYSDGKVLHTDAGLVIQFLRANAAKLKISAKNIFAFGHSRGALALWQSLSPELGGSYSSRASGFVGYQAQSTYQCQEFADVFLVPDDRDTYVGGCIADRPHYDQFQSALGAVGEFTTLPVMLQYAEGFYLADGSQTQIKPITIAKLKHDFDEEHYPNFGTALYNKYNQFPINIGDRLMARPAPNIPTGRQFEGWQAFVTKWLK